MTNREIAETVADVVGFIGATGWNTSKPDETSQKLLVVDQLADAGWTARIGLREGLEHTVACYRAHEGALRG